MNARVVVVDHYDSYTWNLAHLIAAVTGSLPDVVAHDSVEFDDLSSYSHVVLSPGPGHPAALSDFGVGRAVLAAADRPVLGVCLGMQAMVVGFGGAVDRIAPAHGQLAAVTHDGCGIFSGLSSPLNAVRYHSLGAVQVPDALTVTARSQDGVVMGVRHRDLPFEGVQFHPESVLSEHGAAMIGNFLS